MCGSFLKNFDPPYLNREVFSLIFSTLLFIFLFLAVVLLIYYCIPRKYRNIYLFVVSLLFYGYGEPVFVLLMIFSITVNYIYGILIFKYSERAKLKKILLISAIAVNLLMLGYFKYTGFIAGTLKAIPIFSDISIPAIALPIGISFYTFKTISYVIDVYRGKCDAQNNYIAFGTYVSLFPQLIAGPIMRYTDIEDQLENRQENFDDFNKGVKIFLVGLAKKVLIANQADNCFTKLKSLSGENGILGSWIGIIAFTLQIYFDFSGYSDMAVGVGYMFGFKFIKNFDYPYISKSITEFWRRWHISLGTWFRDYVYIPLGGNRCKPARHIFNIMVVWFLTGLWHGATWNFAVWGLYFGVLLIIEKYFLLRVLEKLPAFVSHLYSLFFIVLGWAIFDFTNAGEMLSFIGKLFTFKNGIISSDAAYVIVTYLPVLIVGAAASLPVWKNLYNKYCDKKFIWVFDLVSSALVMFLCVASLVKQSYSPFLYFKF